MTFQTVPYSLQNASHNANLFRQSASSPFATGGVLGGTELTVTQKATPGMGVTVGPGRAKIPGTAVASPSGMTWTTQAMYDVLNDGDVDLTIATSDSTNPRIDLVYVQVQDSFYAGSADQVVAAVATGTPAPTPSVPATPSNALALYRVAVAANATSIVNANLTRVVPQAYLLGAGDTGDVALTLNGGWTNVSGTAAATYRIRSGMVTLNGRLDATSPATTTAFTLPAAARPSQERVTSVLTGANTVQTLILQTNGNVIFFNLSLPASDYRLASIPAWPVA